MSESQQSKTAWLITIAAILVAIFFGAKSCSKPVVKVVDDLTVNNKLNSDSIHKNESIVSQLLLQIDSLKSLEPIIKNRIVIKYKTLHDTIPIEFRDELDSLQWEWQIDEFNDMEVIQKQDSVISTQRKEINLYKAITHNDTLRMQDMSDSIKSNRKYWRGFKHGILTGAILGAGIYVGSKVNP